MSVVWIFFEPKPSKPETATLFATCPYLSLLLLKDKTLRITFVMLSAKRTKYGIC